MLLTVVRLCYFIWNCGNFLNVVENPLFILFPNCTLLNALPRWSRLSICIISTSSLDNCWVLGVILKWSQLIVQASVYVMAGVLSIGLTRVRGLPSLMNGMQATIISPNEWCWYGVWMSDLSLNTQRMTLSNSVSWKCGDRYNYTTLNNYFKICASISLSS